MDGHSAVLRAARPTHDEGLLFARYLDTAAEGLFRLMLGRRSAHILATAFVEENHDLSYRHVTFAERDGVVVGMVSGYAAEQHACSSFDPLIEAAGRRNLRFRIARILLAPLLHILDSIGDRDFYLQAIAVDEKARGGGLGTLLLDSLERRARNSGASRLSLDVSARNRKAIRFYERRGMTIESQWPKRLKIPGLKLYRMAKRLR